MSHSPDKLEKLFDAVVDLAPEERSAYLAQSCANDESLRAEVEGLLRNLDRAGNFLTDRDAVPSPESSRPTLMAEKPGERVGRYKLLEQIGEGGCGAVYMAEQEEPVRRRVALKIIKLGMDTKSVIVRFEAERQALAMMDHPNIAKVHDAGATEAGRPFFVMELVRGIKITDYCDQKNLATQQRLELFVQVCQAIQHAHQKGIIHRDIKPSNILVTVNDGVAVPKVIDFGIAKATGDQRLTDKTVFTAFAQFIGTPAYMSPEQADFSSADIDTRSDIYSLGVLLYELLTGKTPFDVGELLKAGLDEMRRTICEKEPPRPSTRVSTLSGEELTTTAQRRSLEAPKLITLFRGDLDWIAMKCLEKDRSRRYETANGLARDVQRHLDNEAVLARPPNSLYRLRKLVRRNKLLFGAAGAVLAALVLGLGLSTWLFFRERAGRREQTRLRRQAQTEAAKSKQVAQILQDMLGSVSPSVALGRDTTMLREILDKTSERIGRDLTNQPEVEMTLLATLYDTYEALILPDRMEAAARRAVDIGRSQMSQGNTNVGSNLAAALNALGKAVRDRGKWAQAESCQREAAALRRSFFGDQDRRVAVSLSDLADVLVSEGKLAEAEDREQEALWIWSRIVPAEFLAEAEQPEPTALRTSSTLDRDDYCEVAASLRCLGQIRRAEGRLAEAEAFTRRELAIMEKVSSSRRQAAISQYLLAAELSEQGRFEEAEKLNRDALTIEKKLYGDAGPFVLGTAYLLINTLERQGKGAEAEQVLNEIPGSSKWPPAQAVQVHRLRVYFLARHGRFSEAVAELRSAIALHPNPEGHEVWHWLAVILVQTGQLEACRDLCRESLGWAANATDPTTAFQLARIEEALLDALILPSSAPDYETVGKLIDIPLNHPANQWEMLVALRWPLRKPAVRLSDAALREAMAGPQLIKGLAEYREGRFQSASEWMQKVLSFSGNDFSRDVEAYMVLAMARFRLGLTEQARQTFSEGLKVAEAKLPKADNSDLGEAWADCLIAHALLREARALIGNP